MPLPPWREEVPSWEANSAVVKPLALPSIISSGCLPALQSLVGSLPSQRIRPSYLQTLGPRPPNSTKISPGYHTCL